MLSFSSFGIERNSSFDFCTVLRSRSQQGRLLSLQGRKNTPQCKVSSSSSLRNKKNVEIDHHEFMFWRKPSSWVQTVLATGRHFFSCLTWTPSICGNHFQILKLLICSTFTFLLPHLHHRLTSCSDFCIADIWQGLKLRQKRENKPEQRCTFSWDLEYKLQRQQLSPERWNKSKRTSQN